jgi:hypothetical protein
MKLLTQTTYLLDGRTFRSLKEAKTHLENEIGKILDMTPNRMDPKQALAVHDVIVRQRGRLVQLLTVEVESEDWDGENKNLLEMDL